MSIRTCCLAAAGAVAVFAVSDLRIADALETNVNPGDEVVTIVRTDLMQGKETLLHVDAATRLIATAMKDEWIGTSVAKDGTRTAGWVRARDVLPTLIYDRARRTMQDAAKMLEDNHYDHRVLDDQLVQRWRKLYLERLDPARRYFNQTDIDGLMDRVASSNDPAQISEIAFAYLPYYTLLRRVEQRVAWYEQWLSADHDYGVEETLAVSSAAATYASDNAAAQELSRKWVKYDLLVLKTQGVDLDDARHRLSQRYRAVQDQIRGMDHGGVLETYFDSMANAFDRDCRYLAPETLQQTMSELKGKTVGIGAMLRWVDGRLMVQRIISGGPAQRDGRLKSGDEILGVGQQGEDAIENVSGRKLSDVVNMMRGAPGLTVRLVVMPAGQSDPVTYQLTRDTIELEGARGELLRFPQPNALEAVKIGWLHLPSFYRDFNTEYISWVEPRSSSRDARRLLAEFKSAGADAVVIDLRSCTQGVVREAVDMAALFVGNGPIVLAMDRRREVNSYESERVKAPIWTGPLVVLTSRRTANCAEIFAGAIKDYARGLIVGDDRTAGHGTIKGLVNLDDTESSEDSPGKLGGVKVTIEQLYRLNGEPIGGRGVSADVRLPSLTATVDVRSGSEDNVSDSKPTATAKYRKGTFPIDDALRRQLIAHSLRRQRALSEFCQLEQQIVSLREGLARMRISLKEADVQAERSMMAAVDAWEPVPNAKPDFYSSEVSQIALDYVSHYRQTFLSREWTFADSRPPITAELLDVTDKGVRLRRADKEILTISIEELTPQDRQLVTSRASWEPGGKREPVAVDERAMLERCVAAMELGYGLMSARAAADANADPASMRLLLTFMEQRAQTLEVEIPKGTRDQSVSQLKFLFLELLLLRNKFKEKYDEKTATAFQMGVLTNALRRIPKEQRRLTLEELIQNAITLGFDPAYLTQFEDPLNKDLDSPRLLRTAQEMLSASLRRLKALQAGIDPTHISDEVVADPEETQRQGERCADAMLLGFAAMVALYTKEEPGQQTQRNQALKSLDRLSLLLLVEVPSSVKDEEPSSGDFFLSDMSPLSERLKERQGERAALLFEMGVWLGLAGYVPPAERIAALKKLETASRKVGINADFVDNSVNALRSAADQTEFVRRATEFLSEASDRVKKL